MITRTIKLRIRLTSVTWSTVYSAKWGRAECSQLGKGLTRSDAVVVPFSLITTVQLAMMIVQAAHTLKRVSTSHDV